MKMLADGGGIYYKTSGEAVRFNQNSRESHQWTVNFFGDKDAGGEGAQTTINKAAGSHRATTFLSEGKPE